ncbi:hypothetical protein BDZ91DRAFT_790503 [Kalaharituber pfeilii]|nr:hypothetical protein BDZ91DRAFT_790503 [Kalaharituber pfeilii]
MKSAFSLLPALVGLVAAACDDAADSGFATLNGGTTGGAEEPYVIKIPQRIDMDPEGTEIEVASDKTIIGAGYLARHE